MAEPYVCIYEVDLNQPLKRHDVGLLATYDKKANRFGAKLTRDGAAVDVSGCTVYGYFIRPNEHTVLFNGAVSEGIVYVDLPENCYYYDGAFTLSVKIKNGDMEQTVLLCDGRISQTRTDATIDEENVLPPAAPSGYGLGTTGTYCADANNANKSGWYGVDANTTNIPSGASGVMFVKTLSNANGTDIYQTITSGATAIRRYYSSWAGNWQPWEYENPPMDLGVEYRTTERSQGKPVYAVAVDCGALPANSSKTVNICSYSTTPVRAEWSIVNSSNPLRYSDISHAGATNNFYSSASDGITAIVIGTTSNMSGFNAVLTYYYTKD